MKVIAKEIIWQKYLQYLRDWADSHSEPEFYGMTPACFDEWLGCEHEEEGEATTLASTLIGCGRKE